MQPTDEALQMALTYFQAGRHGEAEAAYQAVLRQQPDQPEALHMLSQLAALQGRMEQAVALAERAVALQPSSAPYHNTLGRNLAGMGNLDRAHEYFVRAVHLDPNLAESHNNLGNTLRHRNQLPKAVAAYRRAIALRPDYAEAYYNWSNALRDEGQIEQAIAGYRHALSLRSHFPEALSSLGNLLTYQGKFVEAAEAYRRAIAVRPENPTYHNNLSAVLRKLDRPEEAEAAARQALQLQPQFATAWANLGYCLRQRGKAEEAMAAFRQLLELKPDAETYNQLGELIGEAGDLEGAIAYFQKAITFQPRFAEAFYNLGVAHADLNRFEEALAFYRQALAFRPDYPEAHYGIALIHLVRGDFVEGWKGYENRWRFATTPPRVAQPLWRGEAIVGRTIVLYDEQGLGDTIMFVRYASLVAARGARVWLVCNPALRELLAHVEGVERVYCRGEVVPPFDVRCPLLDLPRCLGTTLETIPARVPYLTPDPRRIAHWRERLAGTRGLRVGLAWAGNPGHRKARARSLSPALLTPLAEAREHVTFFSLQKGPGAELARVTPQLPLIDYTEELTDFADTAGLIANLDLVISADTSIAHLAGALARPVWVFLPFAPDWRWLLAREDSVWYPTMRLFRQPAVGDWATPARQAAARLMSLARQNL
jgi:tetratricopeptide (TPR) repeat protein